MAVVVATAFFAHESAIWYDYYSGVTLANNEYTEQLTKRNNALNDLIGSLDPEITKEYLEEKQKTVELWDVVNYEYEKMQVFNFRSIQEFIGEFGWALGLFIASLFLAIQSFRKKSDTIIGEQLFNGTLLFISLFFIAYCFLGSDFEHEIGWNAYIPSNILACLFLMASAYFFALRREKRFEVLRSIIKNVFFKYVYEDVEDFIDPTKDKEFRKSRIELTEMVVEYEQL